MTLPTAEYVHNNGFSSVLPKLSIKPNDDSDAGISGTGYIEFQDGSWKLDCAFPVGFTAKTLMDRVNEAPKRYEDHNDRSTMYGVTWDGIPVLVEGLSKHRSVNNYDCSRELEEVPFVVLGAKSLGWRSGHEVHAVFEDLPGWSVGLKLRQNNRLVIPDWCKLRQGDNEIEVVLDRDAIEIRVRNSHRKNYEDSLIGGLQDAVTYSFGVIHAMREYRVFATDDQERCAYFSNSRWSRKSPFTPLMAYKHSKNKADALDNFSRYLNYCIEHPKESAAAASHVKYVYHMVNYGPTAMGLSLSIAIEALVKLWCHHRTDSKVTTGRRMKYLQQIGVLDSEHREAWGCLRNRLAHGDLLTYNDDDSEYIWSLYDAFHSLVAWRIGYVGPLAEYKDVNRKIREVQFPSYVQSSKFD